MDPTPGFENEKLIWAQSREFCSDRVHVWSGYQLIDAFWFPEYYIANFQYFSTFGDHFIPKPNVETSFFPKICNIFIQNVVFL